METENKVKRKWKPYDWKILYLQFLFLNQKENHSVELTADWIVSVNLKTIQQKLSKLMGKENKN